MIGTTVQGVAEYGPIWLLTLVGLVVAGAVCLARVEKREREEEECAAARSSRRTAAHSSSSAGEDEAAHRSRRAEARAAAHSLRRASPAGAPTWYAQHAAEAGETVLLALHPPFDWDDDPNDPRRTV